MRGGGGGQCIVLHAYTLGDGDVDEETGVNARQSADNGSTYTSKHDSGLRGVRNLHICCHSVGRDDGIKIDPCVRFQRKHVVHTR